MGGRRAGAGGPTVARLVAAAAAAAAFAMAWLPLPTALAHYLHDDCFYYLKLAENVLLGRGVTLDGSAPTNGFHPLWMGVVLLLRAAAGHDLALRLALSVAAALHVAQAALLFALVRRRAGDVLAWFGAIAFLTSFRLLACNLCGLETPLAGAAVLLVALRLERRPEPTAARAAALGALAGLAALARFDLLLLAVVALPAYALRGGDLRRRVGRLAAAGAACAALLAPWAVWSVAHSGSLLPRSSEALRLWLFAPPSLGLSLAENAVRAQDRIADALHLLPATANALGLWPVASAPGIPAPLVASALVLLPIALLASQLLRPSGRGAAAGNARILALYGLAHFSYYVLLARAEVRYLMPFLLIVLCLALWRAAEVARRGPGARAALAALGAVLLTQSWIGGVSAWQRHQGAGEWHALHPQFHRTALWIARNTRPDLVVGAWNAGILSWFSERTVVNLDGVMNDEAIEALRERRLAAYIDRRRIGVLADSAGEIVRFLDGYGGAPGWREEFRPVLRVPPLAVLARRSERFRVRRPGPEPPADPVPGGAPPSPP